MERSESKRIEFRLNKYSSNEEVRFSLNYPGKGNIIICEDDEIFNRIIAWKEANEGKDVHDFMCPKCKGIFGCEKVVNGICQCPECDKENK